MSNNRKKVFSRVLVVCLSIMAAFALCACYSSSGSSSSKSSSSSSSSSSAPAEQSLPANGHIFAGSESGTAGIEVTAPSSQSCWCKVLTTSGKTQISFFIRAGKTVHLDIPAGTYNIHFACGSKWYGTTNRFGDGTSYGQDKSVTIDSGYYMTYTLQASSNGNWSMSGLSANDF